MKYSMNHPDKTNGKKRSGKWPTLRKSILAKPGACCSVCGATKGKLEVHHIVPFHDQQTLELEPTNLIILCENEKDGVNCHLTFGHLGNFKSFNKDVIVDSGIWSNKIKTRP